MTGRWDLRWRQFREDEHGGNDYFLFFLPEQRARQNFDHPDPFDTPLLIERARRFRDGLTLDRPPYDIAKYLRASGSAGMKPPPAIIPEGGQNKVSIDMVISEIPSLVGISVS